MRKTRVKRDRPLRDVMKKSPALYITMLCVWAVLLVLLWWQFIPKFFNTPFLTERVPLGVRIGAKALLIGNAVFISYFWLNGVKDFIYVIWYYASFAARYQFV